MNQFIFMLRRKLKLTQREMAKILDISSTTLHNYEVGERFPRLYIAYRIIDLATLNDMKITLEDIYPR